MIHENITTIIHSPLHVADINVYATWDNEAKVWVARTEDIRGLVAEAKTIKALESKLCSLIPELIELNN